MTTLTLKSGETFSRVHIHFDSKSRAALERCTTAGSELAGHRVSYSTIIRRALALLEEHQQAVKTPSQERAERAELATVMR
jgi:hypothetical protein